MRQRWRSQCLSLGCSNSPDQRTPNCEAVNFDPGIWSSIPREDFYTGVILLTPSSFVWYGQIFLVGCFVVVCFLEKQFKRRARSWFWILGFGQVFISNLLLSASFKTSVAILPSKINLHTSKSKIWLATRQCQALKTIYNSKWPRDLFLWWFTADSWPSRPESYPPLLVGGKLVLKKSVMLAHIEQAMGNFHGIYGKTQH